MSDFDKIAKVGSQRVWQNGVEGVWLRLVDGSEKWISLETASKLRAYFRARNKAERAKMESQTRDIDKAVAHSTRENPQVDEPDVYGQISIQTPGKTLMVDAAAFLRERGRALRIVQEWEAHE